MKNKDTVLITGASGGIGYELAKVFAEKGFNLVLVARSSAKLNELKKELLSEFEISVKIIVKDLTKENSAGEIYLELEKENIQIAVLVNNAGVGAYGRFYNIDLDRQKDMIRLNIISLVELTHLFLPSMLSNKKGKILNVASTAAFQPGPLMAVYYATKSFVLSFSQALLNELQGTGISVTALCPGPTESGFQKAASIEKVRLVRTGIVPSSKKVALYGYNALMKDKPVAVEGTLNKLLVFAVRFVPRKLITSVVRKLQEITKS
jgi:Short-chain dehydrogenases of various substrate specificities